MIGIGALKTTTENRSDSGPSKTVAVSGSQSAKNDQATSEPPEPEQEAEPNWSDETQTELDEIDAAILQLEAEFRPELDDLDDPID